MYSGLQKYKKYLILITFWGYKFRFLTFELMRWETFVSQRINSSIHIVKNTNLLR